MKRGSREGIREMRMRDDGGLNRLTEETERRILEVQSQDWVTD